MDTLFDIDADATEDDGPPSNLLTIDVAESSHTDDDTSEEIAASESSRLTMPVPAQELPDAEDDPESESDDPFGSFSGLEGMPLPDIASSDEEEEEAPTPKKIPAIPSFQDMMGGEPEDDEPAESAPQVVSIPPITRDTIPKSSSEELPKFELSETQRICAKCGDITTMSAETCDSCGYSDASLGILNSVVAGDTQQASRLLNVKPAVVNTITSTHGWTLLHMAASGGNPRLVDLLIRRGSKVNAKNIYGKTALHYAASKGHLEITKMLLDNDADLDALFEGKTALKHAMENNQSEVVELLKSKGAT